MLLLQYWTRGEISSLPSLSGSTHSLTRSLARWCNEAVTDVLLLYVHHKRICSCSSLFNSDRERVPLWWSIIRQIRRRQPETSAGVLLVAYHQWKKPSSACVTAAAAAAGDVAAAATATAALVVADVTIARLATGSPSARRSTGWRMSIITHCLKNRSKSLLFYYYYFIQTWLNT